MNTNKYGIKDWGGVYYGNECPEPELQHTYWNKSGKQMMGITGTLIKFALGDDLAGVNQKTLMEAAEFGTTVHEEIQDYETWGGEATTPLLKMYQKIKEEHELRMLRIEFVVSDKRHFASPIDMVMDTPDCADDEVILVDIKSTASRNEEKVSLQLSYYAQWFEKQTGLKVKGLYHLWAKKEKVDGQPQVTEIEFNKVARVCNYELNSLKKAYLRNDTEFKYNPYSLVMRRRAVHLNKVYMEYLEAELKLKQAKESYMTAMQEEGYHTIKSGNATISVVAGKMSSRFNSTAWKKDYPELVDKYTTSSVSAPYLTIKFAKEV